MPEYVKHQPQSNQIQKTRNKGQKVDAFLHEEIGESMNSQKHEKFNYKDTNYYNFAELNYYKPDASN